MKGSNQSTRCRWEFGGGSGTGRFDRGEDVANAGAVVLSDPVSQGDIETHALYGPATPNVGSAWALPRSHPLWAPMDFEVKELEAETKREREQKLAKFEPPEKPRRQLTPAEIAQVRVKNMEYFKAQKEREKLRNDKGRVEFIPTLKFEGRKAGYYYGRGQGGKEEVNGESRWKRDIRTQDGQSGLNLGYYIDYAQMRHLMQMHVGDRCEARYKKVRRYFPGMVVGLHDEDCTYDVRFQHGHVELGIPAEHVRRKDWVGKIKEGDGVSRSLKAANPIMEQKDPAVEWYEQLLAWEQGKIDAPRAPEGLFPGGGPGAARSSPLALLDMMAVSEGGFEERVAGTDDDVPILSAGLDGFGGDDDPIPEEAEETEEEARARAVEEEEELEKMKNSGWRQYRLKQPAKTADEAQSDAAQAAQLAVLTVEDVVASGDIWKPETPEYQKFWGHDEYPHRTGPPTDAPYYGVQGAPADDDERKATRDKPYLLNGDASVKKWISQEAPRDGPNRRPVAGGAATYHLVVRRLDGTICMSTYDEDHASQKVVPETHKLFCDEAENGVPNAKRYLQGLHEGISSMRVGETAHFILVPEKAYGRKGRYPAVPGYSKESPRGTWLHFEVELLACDAAEAETAGTELVDPTAFSLLNRPDGYDWQGMDHATTNAYRNEKACAWCRKPERMMHNKKRFKRCGRCKTTLYCSTACGTAAWPHHKLVCAKPEDHVVLEAEAHYSKLLESGDAPKQLTNGEDDDAPATETALATRRTEAIAAFVREKLGDAPPRICVIVAYRNQLPLQDRQPQLFKFVPYMVAFLGYARPRCEFTVVVATQTDDGRKFNRGRLMNAAFKDVVQGVPEGERPYDSVIFHDVDLLPSEELMPYYTTPPKSGRPCHLGGAWRTKYRHPSFVGGVLAFRPEDYVACNGYANDNWGWGLDDQEIALRMVEANLRVVKPPEGVGGYSDLDPINLWNIVHSEERGYYNEWWNMDMENGKCQPRVSGPIVWDLYGQWWRDRGLADIGGHAELIARTHEFGGRVVRLLYALENDLERKEGTVALVSARTSLKACLDAKLSGPVADAALAQTRALAAMGNLNTNQPRLMHGNPELLTPEQRFALQGGREPRAKSASRGQRRLGPG